MENNSMHVLTRGSAMHGTRVLYDMQVFGEDAM